MCPWRSVNFKSWELYVLIISFCCKRSDHFHEKWKLAWPGQHLKSFSSPATRTSRRFSPADWSGVLFCWINLDGTRHPIKLWNRQNYLHRLFKSQTSLNDRELNSSNSLSVRRQCGRAGAVRVLDLQFGGPSLTAHGHPMTVFCKISVQKSKIAYNFL